ncbi:MAG: hypothetical protein R3F37_09205 [Candidatus Competibacteraceae bacterium]
MHEELFYCDESISPTSYPKLLLAQQPNMHWPYFTEILESLREACDRYDEERISVLVESMVNDLMFLERRKSILAK